ncbi:MAG TPA: hypothetical protein PK014_09420 [Thermoanaerobaculia bacterium]|nr:hypothetical protein [Thermoanaerobaculia bacterium]HUM30405.1 hypothetical protein [Thermoanaerobaculia bacterium]HXK68584.1 hypothetical protein [Thermoanaerobaculia bacterium]
MVTITTPSIDFPLPEKALDGLFHADRPYLRVARERQGLEEIRDFSAHAPQSSRILVLGMGGSILGTRAIATYLGKEDRFFFVDNLDSKLFREAERLIRSEPVILVPISKSGGTLETLSMLSFLYPILEEVRGNEAPSRVAVVTAKPSGTLGAWASERKIRIIPMPEDLSGRFSVFSSVGSLPLHLAGIDPLPLLDGALATCNTLETSPGREYFLKCLAVLLSRPHTPLTLFTYGAHLAPTAAWFCQLWAESLGKDAKFGQFPSPARGTADQHSVLQMILDVPEATTTWVWYAPEDHSPRVGDASLNLPDLSVSDYLGAAARGLYAALEERKVNRLFLQTKANDRSTIGGLLMTLMCLTHAASLHLGVSTFDQPAVELAKRFTKENVAALTRK